jgi:Zn-dependent peptidase ImmA (M78 family)/DNA-binding XRE family transcriptional regulator
MINPDLLVWARTSASYELDAAAHKVGIDLELLAAWEAGQEQPSIPQLRKLADLYKRPLAVLFLPERPLAFQPMHDFRRLPDAGGQHISPGLAFEIRTAHQRRELALELMAEGGETPPRFTMTTTLDTPPEAVGMEIRVALGLSYQIQNRWRDPRVAFHAWRSRIEEQGVLVFQSSNVESDEASGFAFAAEQLPFMVVNQKDVHARRGFSLLHELTHLMLHQSGVSELQDGRRRQEDERVEVFCNHVAAAALMPRDDLLSEQIVVDQGGGRREWSEEAIGALAATYAVSREVVVRRLLVLGRTTEGFYARKRAHYANEFAAQRARERAKRGDKGIPRNMPLETVGKIGRPLVRMLLSQYHSDRLSLSEVSGFLGVKARHLPGIEQTVGLA